MVDMLQEPGLSGSAEHPSVCVRKPKQQPTWEKELKTHRYRKKTLKKPETLET